MYIAHKSNILQAIHETEWQCRRKAKGISKSEYWTWLATVTSGDPPVADFSGEDYEIVETNAPLSYETKDDEGNDVTISFNQSGHIHLDLDGTHYHLKWDGSKIIPDDDALAACQLTEEWKRIRTERTRLLTECDYYGNSDVTMPAAWKTYRKKLRDLPADQSDKTKYSDITWPTKPA